MEEKLKEEGLNIKHFNIDALKNVSLKEFKLMYAKHKIISKDLDKFHKLFTGNSKVKE